MKRRKFLGSVLAALPLVGLLVRESKAMAKFKIVNNLPISIPNGAVTSQSFNVPGNVDTIIIHLARCTAATPTLWPDPNTTIQTIVEVSTDNGQSWTQNNGFGSRGGIFLNRDGSEIAETTFTTRMPPNVSRFRLTTIVENGPLDTLLTTEVQ